MNTDLERKTRLGVVWSAFTSIGGQLVTFSVGLILARLLSPTDFGYFAATILFIELGSSIVSSGIVSGLIQRQEIRPEHYGTAFFLALITGISMCLLLVVGSPWIGEFFADRIVGQVLAAMSLYLIILPFIVVPTAILRKRIDFRSTGMAEVTQYMVHGGLSISLAMFGWGVWSLVWGRLTGHLWSAVYLTYLAGWRPRAYFQRQAMIELLPFGAKMAAANMLNDLANNIGFTLVGRLLGPADLGLFHRAQYLMTLPLTRITGSVTNVLYSTFAEVQKDVPRAKRGLLKSTCYITLVSCPALVGLLMTAPALIRTLYGEPWMGAVQPLQVLCAAGLFLAVEPVAVSLITALGYAGFELKRQMVYLCFMIVAMYVGSSWGLVGVAWGVFIAAGLLLVLLQRLMWTIVGVSFRDYIGVMFPAYGSSAAMALVLFEYQYLICDVIPLTSVMMLITSVITGCLVYGLSILLFSHKSSNPIVQEVFMELHQLLARTIGAKSGMWGVRHIPS